LLYRRVAVLPAKWIGSRAATIVALDPLPLSLAVDPRFGRDRLFLFFWFLQDSSLSFSPSRVTGRPFWCHSPNAAAPLNYFFVLLFVTPEREKASVRFFRFLIRGFRRRRDEH